jgi:DNA-binding CsgD family transcriptional regulator
MTNGSRSSICVNMQKVDDLFPRLSPRRLQILNLMGDGYSTVEIARMLGRAHETIRVTVKRMYKLLGARNRAHAIAIAIRHDVPMTFMFARYRVIARPRSRNDPRPIIDAVTVVAAALLRENHARGCPKGADPSSIGVRTFLSVGARSAFQCEPIGR